MKGKNLVMIVVVFGMMILKGSAQDAQFSQFFAAPLYLNPAFAGTDSSVRFGVVDRNQWKPNEGLFSTYELEFDMHINPLHSGFGIMFWNDDAGSGLMNTTNISGIYSFQQHVYKELNFSIGLQGAYMQQSLDWSKITYIGQYVNPRFPSANNQIDFIGSDFFHTSTSSVDISSGIEVYTNEFYGGISISHATEPDQGFISAASPLPVKYTTNLGAMIPVDSTGKSVMYVSPNVIIINQQNYHEVAIGFNIQGGGHHLDILDCGIWYRYNNAMIGELSLHKWGFRITYGYDLAIGQRYSRSTFMANEISLGYKFHSKLQNGSFHPINIPSF